MKVNFVRLGLTKFHECLELQKLLVQGKDCNSPEYPDTILFTEHYPVFTGGKRIKDQLQFEQFPFINVSQYYRFI